MKTIHSVSINKVKHLPTYPTGLLFLGSIAPCISSLFFEVSLMQYWIFFQAFAESTHSVSCAKVFCFCFISDGLLHSPYISRDQHFCLNTSPARESQHCCCRCANVCKKEEKRGCLTKGATKSTNVLSSKQTWSRSSIFFLLSFTSCHLICSCVNVYKQAELKKHWSSLLYHSVHKAK